MRHVVVTLFVLIATFFISKATFQHFIALNNTGTVCTYLPLEDSVILTKSIHVLVIKYDRVFLL
jgi:hypothetical protein